MYKKHCCQRVPEKNIKIKSNNNNNNLIMSHVLTGVWRSVQLNFYFDAWREVLCNKVLVASVAFQLDLFFFLSEELRLSVLLYLHSYSHPAHARGQWSRVSITDLYRHFAGIGSSGRARKIPRLKVKVCCMQTGLCAGVCCRLYHARSMRRLHTA